MAGELRGRAMLVGITTSAIGTRVKDKRGTRAVNAEFEAKNAGEFYRRVIPLEFIRPMKSIQREAYKYHRDHTVPWSRGPNGTSLITVEALPDYQSMVRDCKRRLKSTVLKVAKGYDSMIASQRIANGGLFEEKDIPSVEEFINSFSLEPLDPQSIENTDDLRVHMSEEEVKAVERNFEKALSKSVESTYMKFKGGIERLSESLGKYTVTVDENGKEKVTHGFHATSVTKLKELCDLLPELNITRDPKLDKLAKEVRAKLTKVNVPDLKKSAAARNRVKDHAEEIKESLEETLRGYGINA
jgi:hypothetical protein